MGVDDRYRPRKKGEGDIMSEGVCHLLYESRACK